MNICLACICVGKVVFRFWKNVYICRSLARHSPTAEAGRFSYLGTSVDACASGEKRELQFPIYPAWYPNARFEDIKKNNVGFDVTQYIVPDGKTKVTLEQYITNTTNQREERKLKEAEEAKRLPFDKLTDPLNLNHKFNPNKNEIKK